MARLAKSVAKGKDYSQEVDKSLMMQVVFVEHTFHVGPVTEDFPAMKLFTLCDQDVIDALKGKKTSKEKGIVRTLG